MLLDSDEEEEEEVTYSKPQPKKTVDLVDKKHSVSKPKKKPQPKKDVGAKKEGAVESTSGAGGGGDSWPGNDGAQKRNNDRRKGRGGRGGYNSRGREFDRRSGTGRGREVKKSGGGGHNWGADKDETMNEERAEQEATNEVENGGDSEEKEGEAAEAQEPKEPEVVQLTLEEFMKKKEEERAEMASSDAFKAIQVEKVDESEFDGVVLSKKKDEDDDNENVSKKTGKKNSNKNKKQIVEDVGFRMKPVQRDREGRNRRNRDNRRGGRGGGRGGGFNSNSGNVEINDLNAFPSL